MKNENFITDDRPISELKKVSAKAPPNQFWELVKFATKVIASLTAAICIVAGILIFFILMTFQGCC